MFPPMMMPGMMPGYGMSPVGFNPMMAMMMGKLKISNPAAMLKYAKILGLM